MEFEIEIKDETGRLIYYICGSAGYIQDGARDAVRFMREIKETGKIPKKPVIKSIVEGVKP